MSGPPARRPTQSDPGATQARQNSREVEVRTFEGKLVRMLSQAVAAKLIAGNLGEMTRHCAVMAKVFICHSDRQPAWTIEHSLREMAG